MLIIGVSIVMLGQEAGSGEALLKLLLGVIGLVAIFGVPALLISAGASAVPHKRHYRDEDED